MSFDEVKVIFIGFKRRDFILGVPGREIPRYDGFNS